MSSKAEAQQRNLGLRSVKKQNLFKKKKRSISKYASVISPEKGAKEQAIKKKKILTKEDLELLKLFDHNHDYGPCIGMTRHERWNRAKDNGLEPPEEIEIILCQHPDNPEVQESVWCKYKL